MAIINEKELKKLYEVDNLTQKEIGLFCHVDEQTVRAWMRKFNVPTRNCHEALLLAYERNPERKQKLADALRQHPRASHPAWNKGVPCSDEQKLKISQANKGHPSPMKDKTLSAETRKRMSLADKGKPSPKKGIPQSEEQREKSSKAHMGQPAWNKGIPMREESKRKLSEANKRYWASLSEEDKEKSIKAVLKGLLSRPTRLEQKLIDIIEANNLPFKYVGDGQLWLGYKCPDFININGKKQLIELFGVHWHDVFDVAKRSEHFRQYGFDTLVIWEDEMTDTDTVISKIRKFSRKRVGA